MPLSFRKQSSSGSPTVTAPPLSMPRSTRRRLRLASSAVVFHGCDSCRLPAAATARPRAARALRCATVGKALLSAIVRSRSGSRSPRRRIAHSDSRASRWSCRPSAPGRPRSRRARFTRQVRQRRMIVQRLRQPDGVAEVLAVETAAGVDRRAVLGVAELARAVEVLERQADRIGELVAAGADRVVAMRRQALARRVAASTSDPRPARSPRSAAAAARSGTAAARAAPCRAASASCGPDAHARPGS